MSIGYTVRYVSQNPLSVTGSGYANRSFLVAYGLQCTTRPAAVFSSDTGNKSPLYLCSSVGVRVFVDMSVCDTSYILALEHHVQCSVKRSNMSVRRCGIVVVTNLNTRQKSIPSALATQIASKSFVISNSCFMFSLACS